MTWIIVNKLYLYNKKMKEQMHWIDELKLQLSNFEGVTEFHLSLTVYVEILNDFGGQQE